MPFIGGACPLNLLRSDSYFSQGWVVDQTYSYPFVNSSVPPKPGLMMGASDSTCSFCASFFARSLTSFSSFANYHNIPMSMQISGTDQVSLLSRPMTAAPGSGTACRNRSVHAAMIAPQQRQTGGGRSRRRELRRNTPCSRCRRNTIKALRQLQLNQKLRQ